MPNGLEERVPIPVEIPLIPADAPGGAPIRPFVPVGLSPPGPDPLGRAGFGNG
jgi:hypothetical protein